LARLICLGTPPSHAWQQNFSSNTNSTTWNFKTDGSKRGVITSKLSNQLLNTDSSNNKYSLVLWLYCIHLMHFDTYSNLIESIANLFQFYFYKIQQNNSISNLFVFL
jgi:hypothetical protein